MNKKARLTVICIFVSTLLSAYIFVNQQIKQTNFFGEKNYTSFDFSVYYSNGSSFTGNFSWVLLDDCNQIVLYGFSSSYNIEGFACLTVFYNVTIINSVYYFTPKNLWLKIDYFDNEKTIRLHLPPDPEKTIYGYHINLGNIYI